MHPRVGEPQRRAETHELWGNVISTLVQSSLGNKQESKNITALLQQLRAFRRQAPIAIGRRGAGGCQDWTDDYAFVVDKGHYFRPAITFHRPFRSRCP
jgi:hypothetical protein